MFTWFTSRSKCLRVGPIGEYCFAREESGDVAGRLVTVKSALGDYISYDPVCAGIFILMERSRHVESFSEPKTDVLAGSDCGEVAAR